MKVINIRTHSIPEHDYVYVGRSGQNAVTKYGNPYTMHVESERADVIKLFRDHAWKMLQTGEWKELEVIEELNGKVLGCFCAPKPCHAEVLVALVQYLCNKHGIPFIEALVDNGDKDTKRSNAQSQLGMGVRAFEIYAQTRPLNGILEGDMPAIPTFI